MTISKFRKVWRIGSSWDDTDLLPIFSSNKIAFAGKVVEDKIKKVQLGDILAITKGQEIMALGVAKEILPLNKYKPELAKEFDDVIAIRLSEYFDLSSTRYSGKIYGGRGKQFHEAHKLYRSDITKMFTELNANTNMVKSAELLKNKKQIILQGPPGTGKTYTAKDIAEQIIFGEISAKAHQKDRLEKTDQFKIIQFHPAYSYEDFVRGIEAKTKGNLVEYQTVNRVLAEMAQVALNNFSDSEKDSNELTEDKWLDETFSLFVEDIQDKLDDNESRLILNGTTTYIKLVEADGFRYTGDKWDNVLGNRMTFRDIKEMYRQKIKTRQEIKKMSGVSGLAIQHASYFMKVLDLFYTFLDEKKIPKEVQPAVVEKSYVLIIDEINRANLPSVLGELIYALEYRGEAIDSMYDKEGEGRKIVIPPNLYIIGTMNTADRSVGHIDYAIRRRFAFVDVLPTPKPIKEFALEKFKKVSELFISNYNEYEANNGVPLVPSGFLSSDFRPEDVWIGHSYFITKADGDAGQNELDMKMKYEVIPLLKEYIKDGIFKLPEEALTEINKL